MSAPNTPIVKPTTNRSVAMDIAECGLDAVRDLARLAAATATLSVAADPSNRCPTRSNRCPTRSSAGSVVAVPRTDCPAGAERTADAVLRTGVPASSHQPGPSQP